MPFWNFPAVAGGNINSINNAGLETFRDNPIDSLTREICQNSLDAVKDNNKPVIVEFEKFTTDSFPNKDELIHAFNQAKITWLNGNEKSVRFINIALGFLEQYQIEFLRISDFNTLGLSGAKDAKLGSPWSSLIKEAGSSNKNDDSGGSFGIGKAAPFLNSNIRTLFFSSYDIEGYKSHIGVADIMSFRKENNKVTVGKGYFTDVEESHAIEGLLNLDPSFQRTESGTDIFITAFNNIENWKQEMVHSVLKNFFVTVYQKQLIVRVNGFEINNNNIGELINQLEENEENRILKQYFKLLISDKTLRIPYPLKTYKDGSVFEEGEAELLLLDGEDLNRRVLMTRKTGMRIFEQNNISGSISFTGLLHIKGKNMNKVFKQMENPAHSAWIPSRFEENPRVADLMFSDLRRFLRETVKEQFQQPTSDTMNAVGLSDFLPNKNLLDEEGRDRVESAQPRVISIVSKDVKQRKSKDYQSTGNDDPSKIDEQILGELGISHGEQGGNGKGEGGKGGTSGGGVTEENGNNTVNPNEYGEVGIKEKESKKSIPITSNQKYVCMDKNEGKYKFAILPERAVSKGKLKFKVIGEQSDFDLPINHAHFNDSRITIDKITANIIYFKSLEKVDNLNVNISVDYSDYCVMEVGVYEDQ
jgi:hypothetical protein